MPKRYANTAHFIEATALHRGTSLSVRTILGIRCQASSSQNRMSLVGSEVYARGEPILRMTGVDGQHASAGFALP